MNPRVPVFLAMVPVLLAASAADQTVPPPPQVTFSTEVNYVEVTAVVTAGDDRLVHNLTKDDFQLFERGRPQTITVFSRVEIPFAPPADTAAVVAEPDVRTNRREFTGRVYMIVLDDLHTLPSRTNAARAAARAFIDDYLGPNDLAAIVCASGRVDASQELTSSKALLREAVDRFYGQKLPSSTLERLTEYKGIKEEAVSAGREMKDVDVPDPTDPARAIDARRTLRTLRSVVDWMGAISGRRKSIVLISEGIDYDVQDIFNARSASDVFSDTRDTVAAATRANVSIFSVDPRGLTSLGDEGLDVRSVPQEAHLNIGPATLQREVRMTQDSLRVLSDETGGFALVNANDLRDGMRRIVEANSFYYLLGYSSPHARPDGKFHPIEVRVNRPGLRVRARKGFVVPKINSDSARAAAAANISPQLRRAIEHPLPLSGVALAVSAAAFRELLDPAGRASVAVIVEVDAATLSFTDTGGVFRDTLEVALMLVDPAGKTRTGDRHSVDLKLKPDTFRAVRQSGIRIVSRMLAAPGRYQLKVAARETNGGRTGSVLYDLIVPAFDGSPLSMSGVVLTSTRANLLLTVKSDAALEELLPAPPTTDRTFTSVDTIAVAAELYGATTGGEPADVTTTVVRGDGRLMFRATEAAELARWTGPRYAYKVLVPLRDFSRAQYTLNIEVRARSGARSLVDVRRVPFEVASADRTF